ncbi:MAG TPA: DUF1868 domain-containing protein [Rhodanobacter sp.]
MKQVFAEMRAQLGDVQMTWLPPSSFHMTVFGGSLDACRLPVDAAEARRLRSGSRRRSAFAMPVTTITSSIPPSAIA